MAILSLSETNNKENIPSTETQVTELYRYPPISIIKKRRLRKPLEDITNLFYATTSSVPFILPSPISDTTNFGPVSCTCLACRAENPKRVTRDGSETLVLKSISTGALRRDFRELN